MIKTNKLIEYHYPSAGAKTRKAKLIAYCDAISYGDDGRKQVAGLLVESEDGQVHVLLADDYTIKIVGEYEDGAMRSVECTVVDDAKSEGFDTVYKKVLAKFHHWEKRSRSGGMEDSALVEFEDGTLDYISYERVKFLTTELETVLN